MTDPFPKSKWAQASDSAMHSANSGFAITPSDESELAIIPRAVYIGGAGDLVVKLIDDEDAITFVGIQAGSLMPIRPKQILDTDTTATAILGIY
jgi:hypothetical protein